MHNMASQDIWEVLAVLPDVEEYFSIFDDYLDFKIHPWDAHGFDQGTMFPERKVALRFLTLAMNMARTDPASLPTDLHAFMSDYQPNEYKIPASQIKHRKRKYSDVRNEMMNDQDVQGKAIGTQQQQQQSNQTRTGLSRQSMQGFDMNARRGANTYDVIERRESRMISKTARGERYIDTTTRSVFWDVPGEDAINPDTFDWKRYSSPEDIDKVENPGNKTRNRNKKT